MEDPSFQFPANKQKAQTHRLANRIFKGLSESTGNHDKCKCCDKRVGELSPSVPICYSPINQLIFLGPGVSLLFVFIQNGIAILLVLALVFSIYGTVTNVLGNSCSMDQNCLSDIFNQLTLTNKINDSQSVMIQFFLIAAFLLLYFILTQFLIYRIRKRNKVCDEIINSPSDYSLIIQKLPENVQPKDIEAMINEHKKLLNYSQRQMTKDLQVKKIIISYSLENYLKQKEQQQSQFIKLKKKDENAQFHPRIIERPTKTASFAIVIFSRQMSKQMFLEDGYESTCKNMFKSWEDSGSFTLKDKTVLIARAPEPDDIIWENADIPRLRLARNIFLSYLVGLLILASGGVIQYYLQYFQLKIKDPVTSSYFSYVTSVIVNIYNSIIVQFLILVTKSEGHVTKTGLDQSLMIKICLYSFFNAGIFYSLASILAQQINNFDIQGGFSFEIILFMALNAVTPHLTNIILKKIQFPAIIFRYLLALKFVKYTQKQANQLYERPLVDFPVLYSYVIKTIWLTCFYAPFAPIVVPISIFGLILFYFTEGEIFRTSYNVPNMLSLSITKAAIRLLDSTGVILSVGQILIVLYIKFTFKSPWTPLEEAGLGLCLAFSIVILILPSYNLNKYFFPFQNKYQSPTDYNQASKQFQSTYQGTNPLSDLSQRVRRSDLNLMKFLRIFDSVQMKAVDQSRAISHPLLGLPPTTEKDRNESYFTQFDGKGH